MHKIELLIVDDNEKFRQRMAIALKDRGLEVHEAANLQSAFAAVKEKSIRYVLLDLKLEGENGLTILKALKEFKPELKIVLLTGYASIATATQAIRLGAINYLPKPADADQILKSFGDADMEKHMVKEDDLEPPSLARIEWEHIQRVLTDCEGNITRAAEKLGLHRRSLQRKLQKHAPK